MTKKEPKIKIFVSHHKPGYIYEDDVFVPIQVGKKNSKVDLGILGDDTGDNISSKNSNYAELTAQYWVWKNYDLSDVDYVGFCHYRRYMTYGYNINLLKFWNNFTKIDKSNLIQSIYGNIEGIRDYILGWSINTHFQSIKIAEFSGAVKNFMKNNDYDLYLPKQSYCVTCRPFHQLGLRNQVLWETVYNIIINKYSNYEQTIKYIDNLKWCNWCNIGIMKKELFIEYSERLFSICLELENELNHRNLLNLGLEEPMTAGVRFLGCLGERLFNLYIFHKRGKGLKISNEASMVFFTD